MAHLAAKIFPRTQLKQAVHLAGLVMRLVWHASPGLILVLLLLLFLQALLLPLQLVVVQAMIDRAAFDLGIVSTVAVPSAWFPLATWCVCAVAIVAVSQLIQPFSATLQSLAGDRFGAVLMARLLDVTDRWYGLARFEDPHFVEDLQSVRGYAVKGGLDLVLAGSRALVTLGTLTSLALLLLGLHPLAPLVLILTTLPQMQRHWDYLNRTSSHLYTQTVDGYRLAYSRDMLLAPGPAKDVRLYNLGPFFLRYYVLSFARTIEVVQQIRRRLTVAIIGTSILATAGAGCVYGYLVWRIASGQHSLGDMALYGSAILMLQTQLLGLGSELGFFPMAFGSFLPSLSRVLEAPPDLPIPPNPAPAPCPIRQGIVFDQVTFTYPGRPEPVLREVSFHIHPDECIALVGHNGAGKTTLIKLLFRLYDPNAGRILLDGIDLRAYDLVDLRRIMGVIFQDFIRYDLSAGLNIGLGQVEAIDDRACIERAAASAGAIDLISQLPEGFDTQLGRGLGGRDLSGGEWQKLALARAFMRDCQLLVLDEPTAALDVQAEYDLYTRFHTLTHSRMVVLISHRLATVRMADRVLYLAEGRIVEEGSHAELLARDGAYARLYRLQAAQYLAESAAITEAA